MKPQYAAAQIQILFLIAGDATVKFLTRIVIGIGFIFLLSIDTFAQELHPAEEFLNGETNSFSVDGHPKARGINFVISYPSSWIAEEGKRPNIVQKFTSEGGRGLESAVIIALALPTGAMLTDEEVRELFSDPEFLNGVPPDATLIDSQVTEIEASPAGILEYAMRVERAGMTAELHVWQLNFVLNDAIVQIQFSVAGPGGAADEVSRRMATFKPLFLLMANSIMFPDKWSTVP